MLKDVLGELRAICGTGLAQLHAWASYEIAPVVAVITSRLQYAFRPTRLALPADRARNWVIHDIKIGNQSQFRSADPLSGSEFSAVNTPLDLDLVRPGQDVAVSVEYVGDNPDGEEFRGTLIGRNVDSANRGARMVLPIASNVRIRAVDCGRRVLLDLGDRVHRFEERRGVLDRIVIGAAGDVAALCRLTEESAATRSIDLSMLRIQVVTPPEPLVVSLHAESLDQGHMLFGVEEATDQVVFDFTCRARSFAANCDLGGYSPPWLR